MKVPSWNPPGDGWLKCNFDGACYPDGKGATGAVIRDHNGTFHGGSAKWYGHCMDALTMEALAFRDAVIFAKQRGATRVVVFETDCHSLIHLWSMEDEQRSMFATILREIHDLGSSLVSFSLCYARVCNLVAHELARQVSSSSVMVEWLQVPSCVQRYLETDCNHALE